MKTPPFAALGIDVGGTKIAAGVVQFPEGKISAEKIIATAPERGGKPVLDDVVRLAEELVRKAPGMAVHAIGLGLCELVDPTGRIMSANCIRWRDQRVAERLGKIAPVVIEADVRAAALAEALFGAGHAFRIFLYITIGTGISSCLMIEGKPFVGARGATGTMASSPISVACEKCGHLNRRTLEEIASGPALAAGFNKRPRGAARKGEDILAAVATGDDEARQVVQSAGESLGSMVGMLVNVLDPEAVIVGGGLGLSEGAYWETFIESARRHIWSEVNRDLPILRAATGKNAGLIGAAAATCKKGSGSFKS